MDHRKISSRLHRVAAVITFLYFFLHVFYVQRRMRRSKMSPLDLLRGDNTMWPQKHDLTEFGQTLKWFLGLGERPRFGAPSDSWTAPGSNPLPCINGPRIVCSKS